MVAAADDRDRYVRSALDALFQGTVADPSSPPATLTLEDLQRAYATLRRMDDAVLGFYDNNAIRVPGNVNGDSVASECHGHGCRELREERDIALLQTVYTHIGPHFEPTSIAVPDRLSMTGFGVRAFLLGWLRLIHGEAPGEAPMPEALERERPPLCWLCGQERDPDVEPVTLELPPGGPNPNYRYANNGTVEACSATCATAYAMRMDMAREHDGPRTQRQRDQVEYEATVTKNRAMIGTGALYDSTPARAWNPWGDDDAE